MWKVIPQVMMPIAKDARSQFKQNRVEARICFCPFCAFPKFRASHRDFFLSGVKWYINQTFFDSFDQVCIPKPPYKQTKSRFFLYEIESNENIDQTITKDQTTKKIC